jgi:D-ribose pyranose/furanose isomerase RbsD
MNKLNIIIACLILAGISCNQPEKPVTHANWKQQLNDELPLLGHRNWILVVDKAFPMQSAQGMEIINTNEKLLPVLQYTLEKIDESTHVKPIIFTDKEMNYITEAQSPGVTNYKSQLKDALGNLRVQRLLHDSVFVKMDASSKLFKVLVLKTNETFAYSSVFIQLDCAYWSADKEKQLRDRMMGAAK